TPRDAARPGDGACGARGGRLAAGQPRPDADPLMALKATIFKAEIQVADMDRHHYADYSLTLARHPSETDERMMVRLLAFALFADPALGFGKGLCVGDEPDLWQKDLTGTIERWIDVGQPDDKWTRKACGRARGGAGRVRPRARGVVERRAQQARAPRQPARVRARPRGHRRARAHGRTHDAPAVHHPGWSCVGGQQPRHRGAGTKAAPRAGL